MSVKATAWAFEQRVGDSTRKVILLALADFSDNRNECFPSQAVLAEIAECSVDTVQRHLKKLEAAGYIQRSRRHTTDGNRTSDRYMLSVGNEIAKQPEKPVRQSRKLRPDPKPQNAVLTKPQSYAEPKPQSYAVGTITEPSSEVKTPVVPKGTSMPAIGRAQALEAFHAYNATALACGLPQAAKMTPDRERKIVARLRDYGADGWARALANIDRSSFLTGINDRGWRADLDWLLTPAKFAKVHDGGYGNGRHAKPDAEAARAAELERYRREAAAIIGG